MKIDSFHEIVFLEEKTKIQKCQKNVLYNENTDIVILV